VGFQNSATVVDLGFLRGPIIFVEEAAKHRSALDPDLGEVSDRVIGYGRVELAAAMRSSAVVVGLVPGEDVPQMAFAEDQHPVGDLGPGSEHEAFRVGIRLWASRGDLDHFDACAGQDRVE
jgi:hypothetical protein